MYRASHYKRFGQRGLSLIEMIVVVALLTVISAAVFGSITQLYRHNGHTIAQSYQVMYARDGMDQLIRDIREMTFADDGTFPLVVMEDDSIGFYSDIDRDDSVEYVTYILSSTTLEKRIYNATGTPSVYASTTESVFPVSEYVQNTLQNTPIFTYYDTDGLLVTASTSVTDIRYVQVSIIVNIDPIRDPGQYMLRSSASLRNLKGIQ